MYEHKKNRALCCEFWQITIFGVGYKLSMAPMKTTSTLWHVLKTVLIAPRNICEFQHFEPRAIYYEITIGI